MNSDLIFYISINGVPVHKGEITLNNVVFDFKTVACIETIMRRSKSASTMQLRPLLKHLHPPFYSECNLLGSA